MLLGHVVLVGLDCRGKLVRRGVREDWVLCPIRLLRTGCLVVVWRSIVLIHQLLVELVLHCDDRVSILLLHVGADRHVVGGILGYSGVPFLPVELRGVDFRLEVLGVELS